MSRTVIDLDARATVLDAAERLTEAPPDGDVALVVAAGAPLLRNAVFLDVLRGLVGPRRLSIVTADARARSVASSAHVPAYVERTGKAVTKKKNDMRTVRPMVVNSLILFLELTR